MGGIIILSIFALGFLCLTIYIFTKREWAMGILGLVMTVLFAFLVCDSIQDYRFGPYKDLITVDEMEHKGTKLNGTYYKDRLTFSHKTYESDFEDEFKIEDYGEMNLNIHEHILNKLFEFKEGTVQLIYQHLKDYSNHFEAIAEMTLYHNHMKLYIKYYPTGHIEYEITRVKEYRMIEVRDEDDNTQKEKEMNSEYNTKYVNTEFKIDHYNEDYIDFDRELVSLMIDKDSLDAHLNRGNTNGIYHLDYCFGSNYCTGNLR